MDEGKSFIQNLTVYVKSARWLFSTRKIMCRIFPTVMAHVQLNRTQYLMLFCPEIYKIITRIAGFSGVREGPFMQIG